MTQLNGNYYIVAGATTNTYTLTDLNGNAIDTTAFTAYVSGGTAQRVYTLTTPYIASDLGTLKFAQNVQSLILCHANYLPAVLTINTANSWTLNNINFGATIATPTNQAFATNLPGGSFYYGYVITAVDINGQESIPTSPVGTGGYDWIGNTVGTNTLTWTATPGAQSYNIYKALAATAAIVVGANFGFIANVTGTSFQESYPGINADFSQSPPVAQNPFQGAGVVSYTVTASGTYTVVPGVNVAAAPGGGYTATAYAVLGLIGTPTISSGGAAHAVNDILTGPNGIVLKVTSVGGGGVVTGILVVNPGSISAGSTPSNPL